MLILVASAPGALDITLVAAIGAVLLLPVAVRIVRRRFDPFEPLVVFGLVYGVMFVFRPLAMILSGDVVQSTPLGTYDVSNTFTEMLILALLGSAGFVIGYLSPVGRRLVRTRRKASDEIDAKSTVLAALGVALLGLMLLLTFFVWSDGLQTLRLIFSPQGTELAESVSDAPAYLWDGLFLLVPATLSVAAVAWNTRSKLLIALALFLGGLVCARALPLGDRGTLLFLVGGVVVLYYVRRGARPATAVLIGIAVVSLFGSAFLRDLRGRGERAESVGESLVKIITSPKAAFGPLIEGPETEMAPALAAALGVIPEELPYRHGEVVFGDLVTRPIPRAVWDGKPLIPRQELIKTIWPVEYERYNINPEFSVLVYFYWDFGVIGVVVGLCIYGILARLLYEYLQRNETNLFIQVLFALALWVMATGARDGPVETVVRSAFIVGPTWIIFRASTWRPVVLAGFRRATDFIRDPLTR